MIERAALSGFVARLREPRRLLLVVAGPRQAGMTTPVAQPLEWLPDLPSHSASAYSPGPQPLAWVAAQWELGRGLAREHGRAVLVLDEIEKIPRWTEEVERLWEERIGISNAPARPEDTAATQQDGISAAARSWQRCPFGPPRRSPRGSSGLDLLPRSQG